MTESDELLFSSKPRSFKMDRRSRQASRLKAAVLQKLIEFLDDYTDDDLAEYIVVLICNGKHQNQARDDLDAFLGNSSGKFVSWLWNHLSEEICKPESLALAQPLVNKDDSTACHVSNTVHETKAARGTGFDSHHLLSNGDPRLPIINSKQKPPADVAVLEASQTPDPGYRAPFIDVNCKESQQQTSQPLSRVATTNELRKTTKICHSSDKNLSEISCNDDKAGLNSEDRYQKIAVSETSSVSQHSLSSRMRDFSLRNERSIIREKPQGLSSVVNVGRSSTQAIDSGNGRRRVSVWDRLGKPCRIDDDANDADIQNFVTGATGRKRVHPAENWSECKPKLEEHDIKQKRGDAAGMTGVNEHPAKIMLLNLIHEHQDPVHASNSTKRIRQSKVKGVHDSLSLSNDKVAASQIEETCEKIQQSAPINSDASAGPKELLPISRNASCSRKSTKPLPNSNGNSEISTANPNTQISHSNLLMDKLVGGSVLKNSNRLPAKSEISDFDSQLYKVKKAMLELQTKQVEISKDAKRVSSGSSTHCHGAQNHHAEDAEGRTIFVANVHFAASKQALLLHFSKFGPVVDVTLLMDSMTGMPKGCAYIVFRLKDSAEKALSLNGTSFFSRTLKVMWKADIPEDNLEFRRWTTTSSNYSWSQGAGLSHFHNQYYAPHLKWKREHQGNEEIPGRGEHSRNEVPVRSEASSKQG